MTTFSRAWAERGKSFVVKAKQGRESVHAYFTVDPKLGEAMLYLNPLVNTEAMASFLVEVAKAFPRRKILMFLDRAGWHVAKKLSVPRSITISPLPPHSPELNPAELLWRHVRQGVMHNRVFDSLKEVLDALDEALMGLGSDDLKRICACGYL